MAMEAAWIRLPEAAALLESCAACPPPTRLRRTDLGSRESRYCSTVGLGADRRVARLRQIHQDAWRRLYDAYARGEASAEACHRHLDFDAQAAIRAAIAEMHWLEAAE